MGTDIHFYVERNVDDKWLSCDTWETEEYLDEGEAPYKSVPWGKRYYDGRNYDLFAILADVRNGSGFAGVKTGDGFSVISEPRGLPVDMSDELREEAGRRLEHTPTWLLVSEIMAFDWTQVTTKRGIVSAREFLAWRAWDRGHGLGPKEYSGGIWGANIKIIEADEMERRVVELEKSKRKDGLSNREIRDAIAAHLHNHYCEASWQTPYYRAASNFLSECLPRLWRLGDPAKVRCVFWFDN